MTCDVIIVSYCSSAQLPGCLTSTMSNSTQSDSCRIFVVDNASTDHSAMRVRDSFPRVTLIENTTNIGYGAAINRALELSEADCVLCMNPDVRLQKGAIDALLQCMERHPDAITAAPKLIYPNGSFHPVCRRFPSLWRNFCHVSGLAARMSADSTAHHWLPESDHHSERDVDMVSGACVMFRREYLDRIGGFDENIFLYEEESDVFLPTRTLGGRAYFCPAAEAVHEHGASVAAAKENIRASFHRLRSKYYIYRKHFGEGTARVAYLTDRCICSAALVRNPSNKEMRVRYKLTSEAYRAATSTRTSA